MKRRVILPALLLGACTSSYQTIRLDRSGDFPEAKRGQAVGVPFTLTKPEFTIKKIEGSDPERFQITVNYVPDPSQRYALRLDPTWLSKIDFNIALGPSGGLASTSADVKDQIIPFTASAIKLAASVAQAAAALSVTATDIPGCLASKGPGALAKCAIQNTAASECPSDAGQEIVRRVDRALIGAKEDKGAALDTLFARSDDEEQCFRNAAKLLGEAVGAKASAVASTFKEEAVKAGIPAPTPDNLKDPLVLLGFRAATLLTEAGNNRDVNQVRKLAYATQLAAKESKPQYLQKLLKLESPPAVEFARLLQQALVAPEPAENEKAGRIPAAENMLEAANGDRVQKAFAGIENMTAGQWRARYIPVLQQELADAERSAIKTSSPADSLKFRRIAADRRKKLAELVNMAPDLARLERLEAILDAVPAFDARQRHSRIAEYQGYAKQAAEIRTELATRLAAAVATEKAPKKEAVLPISLPWVSRACITQSTAPGWIYTGGAEAAEYVIVLRSDSGDIVPPPVPKPVDPTEIQMPECGA
jgi:hypothetical protein